MKKIISIVLAAVLLSTMSITTFATDIDQDSEIRTAETEITTTVKPTYVITIPDKTAIKFGDTETTLGTVKATQMQIEPNHCVRVVASAGELQNQANTKKIIPYKLMSGTEEFNYHSYVDTVDKVELKIAIAEDAWNKAIGGSYKGIITFTVSYESMVN